MKRSTFRAWKCRLGVHRFHSCDDVKHGYICKDCRIDLSVLYRYFLSKRNELIELAPKAPFMVSE